jgi:hypothetical protein
MLRLLDACVEESRKTIDTKDERLMGDITLSLAETIFDPRGALPNPKRSLTPRQLFYRQLFFDFRELFEAYQTLLDCPALSRSKPTKKSGLSPARLVRFWREAYLNELYIFLARLKAYIKRVARAYGHDHRVPHLREIAKEMEEVIDDIFSELVEVRSGHVHKYRYEHSDPELNRIQLFELLAVEGKMKTMQKLYREGVRQAEHQSIVDFRIFNRKAKDVLEAVFDSFDRFMVDKSKRLIYPANLKS